MQNQVMDYRALVPQVREKLSALCELPSCGILAGQALASAILDVLGKGPVVYNDIDVFHPVETTAGEQKPKEPDANCDMPDLTLPIGYMDEYEGAGMSTSSISIKRSQTEGILNQIWFEGNDPSPAMLVSSFDLNCVEVALDLKTNELVWSKGFDYFVKTKELQVTSVQTPIRTLLRYFKKKEELKAFGQDEVVKSMFWCRLSYERAEEPGPVCDKFLRLAEKYSADLGEVVMANLAENSFQVLPSRPQGEALQHELNKLFDLSCNGETARATATRAYLFGTPMPAGLQHDFEVEADKRGLCLLDKDHEFSNELFGQSLQLMGWKYLQGQRSPKHFEVIEEFLEKHPAMHQPLIGLTLDEQYRTVLDLKRAAKQHGDFILGRIETGASAVELWNDVLRAQAIQKVLVADATEILTQAIFEPQQLGDIFVQELVTAKQLREEGSYLFHCVGGYSSAVKQSRSKILSLRAASRSDSSTAEVRIQGNTLRLIQHRSVGNKEPRPQNRAQLNAYLQDQCQKLGLEFVARNKPLDSEAQLEDMLMAI